MQTYIVPASNPAGDRAPGANDDLSAGWDCGSEWYDTTTDTAYKCVRNTPAGAIWMPVGAGPGGSADWADITNKPTAYLPSAHEHLQSDVVGLEDALDAKVETDDPRLSDARAPTAHDHDTRYYTEAEVDALLAGLPSGGGSRFPQAISLGGYVVVTNVGTAYDAVALSRGLGLALVDFTGVASLEFRVWHNKIGSGTVSYQLWSVTDGAEILVANDSGSAGERVLTVTKNSGLPTGVKLVRVRAKSTTAADDPVHYGSCLLMS